MINTHRSPRSFSLLLSVSLAGVAAASAGCSAAADETVRPHVAVIDQTKSGLSAATITSIAGTYGADCGGRDPAGTDTWTATLSGAPASDELSVIKNDADCVLTVETIAAAGTSYIGAPAIVLGTAYQSSASAFAASGQPLDFHANARISALTFASDFTISVLVSDAPNATDAGSRGAAFATQTATVTAGTVTAPDYTASFAGFNVAKDVDNVVQSVSGSAQLAEVTSLGQDYAVYLGALTGASSVADIETAYAGAATSGTLASLTTLQIPASAFGLAAVDLDTSPTRTIIVRNTVQGVASYQLLRVTFIP